MSFPRGIVAWISNRHCEERSDAAIQRNNKKNSISLNLLIRWS
ncbi:hypothetical protein [Rickettsia felis]|nr:hypothetical protein [Rickettsia felis]